MAGAAHRLAVGAHDVDVERELGRVGRLPSRSPHLLVSDWKVSCEPDVRTCTLFTAAMPPACCSAGAGRSAGLPPSIGAASVFYWTASLRPFLTQSWIPR